MGSSHGRNWGSNPAGRPSSDQRLMRRRGQRDRSAGLGDRLRFGLEAGRDRVLGSDELHFVRRDRIRCFFRRALAIKSDLRLGEAALPRRRIVHLVRDAGLLGAGDE